MIESVGFTFDKAKAQWLAAFKTAADSQGDQNYELVPLDQIEAKEAEALEKGNMQAVAEFGLAAAAIRETNDGLRATPNDLPYGFTANLFEENPLKINL